MTIEITVNSVDKTQDIISDSILKEDNINEQRDVLNFQTKKYSTKGFEPKKNEEVVMKIDGETEFAGVILSIEKSIRDGQIVVYAPHCIDYSQYLDRKLVLERYSDKTINYIIGDIVDKYTDGFTVVNVDCDIEIKTMSFNRMTVTTCIDKLAKTMGYSWYVDYEKDIHFFEKNENPAPFSVTDINGKYLQNTLSIIDDLSQIRNRVIIRGAEERGEVRVESYTGTGGQIAFPLVNKFAEAPSVKVDTVAQDVGVDYLDVEADYDCFWNFNEKYMRFKSDMDGKVVEVTGIPLFPIIVNILDGTSIIEYGTYEFFKEDKSIASRTEALQYAQSQLEAYKDGVIEGSFSTNTSGLRSGQIININSDLLGVDEDFLIQKVRFRIIAKDRGVWDVTLATMRTVGMIQILQDLIKGREIKEFDPDTFLTFLNLDDSFTMTDGMTAGDAFVTSSPPYTWEELGTPEINPIIWNKFTWEA